MTTKIFNDTSHVWTSENFRNLILSKQSISSEAIGDFTTTDIKNIKEDIKLSDIVFKNIDELLASISKNISAQINWEAGNLLNDSSANIFYVHDNENNLYAVLVRWESAQGLWRCWAYLQEGFNIPNIRIFHP